LELLEVAALQQTFVDGKGYLRLQPLVYKKIHPVSGGRVGLGQRTHIVVVVQV